jgi:hypothetical protein
MHIRMLLWLVFGLEALQINQGLQLRVWRCKRKRLKQTTYEQGKSSKCSGLRNCGSPRTMDDFLEWCNTEFAERAA